MKIKSFSLKLFSLLITLFSIFFFAGLFVVTDSTKATIQAISGNQFVLTASVGNATEHYFRDNANNSTLQNAKVSDEGGKYYSIVSSSGLLLGKTSSGYGAVITTSDMNALIEKGVLYVRAEFSFQAKNNNNQSNIKVTLSQGTNSCTVTTSHNGGQETTYSTDLLKLSTDQGSEIRFSFTTLSQTEVGKYSSFVLSQPTIKFYTQIESFEFSSEKEIVSAGESVKLNASNDVLQIGNTTGNLLSYSKQIHAAQYEFVSGEEYAKIVGNYLYINSDAPQGAEIEIKAKCRKNSFATNAYFEEFAQFTISSSKVQVKVESDFSNPPKITGEGLYNQGRRVILRIDTNKKTNGGFNFGGWYVNGQNKGNGATLNYTVNAGDKIEVKLTKDTSISSITVADKIYDGTTDVDVENVIYNFSGVEKEHEVWLSGLTIKFANASAGKDKVLDVEGIENMSLAGEDANLYVLTKQTSILATGTILKRDVTITPANVSKYYGDADPSFAYDKTALVEGQSLYGSLSRQAGEEIGKYAINLGSLATDERNSNYNIILSQEERYLTIEKRPLSISNLSVLDKEYDKTTAATFSDYKVTNIVAGEDVSVKITGEFEDCNAATMKKVKVTCLLEGEDKNNYTIEQERELTGNIVAKKIVVKAKQTVAIFGDEIDLDYSVDGLLKGDSLQGSLQIDDYNVGSHTINLGTLSNKNYSITYQSANCQITQRDVYVTAQEQTKQYGDDDPELTYTLKNDVEGQLISGSLTRVAGEDVGLYAIEQGSIFNPNYNIIFTSANLSIIKRNSVVQISFLDKVYDGTLKVEYQANFADTLSQDQFALELDAVLQQTNVGLSTVVVQTQPVVSGEKLGNYNFSFVYQNNTITIERRPVEIVISSLSKVYGEEDPQITYKANNIVLGQSLVGQPKRNQGEDVGEYLIYLDDLNNQNNPNYTITYSSEAVLKILPKQLEVSVQQLSKTYGDEDPEFSFVVEGGLEFDDTQEDITGVVTRQSGESVGRYPFSMESQTNKNYTIVFKTANFVINKRPITVIAEDATKIYGEEDPVFSFTSKNHVPGDVINLTIKRFYGENVGDYEMMLGTANDTRYDITFVPGYLTILPSKIMLKAEDKVKVYGDEDPSFSVTIVEGLLKNNDVLANIEQGQMERVSGEDVGSYQISQGSYNWGDNYEISFQNGIFEIVEQSITVTANKTTKQYGNADPVIGFSISAGSLKFNDSFVGALTRQPGESLGTYLIEQGSLSLSENYILEFVSNDFVIEKRQIEIRPTVLSKIYGEAEPEISYQIVVGSLVNGEKLDGELYREKPTTDADPYLYEDVGVYKIHSTLSHENYQINFGSYYFEIEPRQIEIRAEGVSKIYGQEDPELVYTIVNEQDILPGDVLQGSISRVAGENAGNYDIRSSLTLGRNYTINFERAVFTIKPIQLVVKTQNYTKTYGSMDPVFDYEIVEGQLINSDVLYGSITREQGEDVGVYKMLSTLSNINYHVTLQDAYLVIEKKDVYMLAGVYDKVFDGTDVAQIKTPVVSGLVDKNITLSYDKNNCARFETSQVGDNIPVLFHDIVLTGEKAGNYNLVLPTDVTGSITHKEVVSQNEQVIIEALDSAELYSGTLLYASNFDIAREDMGLNKYQVINGFSIRLERDGQDVELNGTISLTIKVDPAFADRNNIYVYHKTADGHYVLLNSENEDGTIKINIDELGDFVLLTDNDAWIDVVCYVCIAVLGLFALCYVIYLVRTRQKDKQQTKKSS